MGAALLFGGVALVPLMPAAPASAASFTRRRGSGTAATDSGDPDGTPSAPRSRGTRSNPFKVDYDGKVEYAGTSNTVITDHSWRVKVFGIPVKSGGSQNGSRQTRKAGVEKVNSYIPFRFTGLYYVSGGIRGTGG